MWLTMFISHISARIFVKHWVAKTSFDYLTHYGGWLTIFTHFLKSRTCEETFRLKTGLYYCCSISSSFSVAFCVSLIMRAVMYAVLICILFSNGLYKCCLCRLRFILLSLRESLLSTAALTDTCESLIGFTDAGWGGCCPTSAVICCFYYFDV